MIRRWRLDLRPQWKHRQHWPQTNVQHVTFKVWMVEALLSTSGSNPAHTYIHLHLECVVNISASSALLEQVSHFTHSEDLWLFCILAWWQFSKWRHQICFNGHHNQRKSWALIWYRHSKDYFHSNNTSHFILLSINLGLVLSSGNWTNTRTNKEPPPSLLSKWTNLPLSRTSPLIYSQGWDNLIQKQMFIISLGPHVCRHMCVRVLAWV